ncbi:MAG: DUF1289 domain-containing protein [Pontibacterium sp.]
MTTQANSPAKPVRSPCVGVCALDEHDVCIACHRHGMEIAEWGTMNDDEKRAVYAKIVKREKGEIVPL